MLLFHNTRGRFCVRVTSAATGDTKVVYTYDGFGRGSQQVTKHGETTVKTDSYTFQSKPDSTNTSAQVQKHTVVVGGVTKEYTYAYDGKGNITSISDGTNTTSYVYDSANQLVRENNQAGNFTYTWEYDNAGNIQNRKEYAYTTGELGTPAVTVNYTYGDETWGDLLTAYNGQEIEYDQIGNPESIDGWSFTWQHGRQLASMAKSGVTWSFTYNADGLRTKRTNGTTTYSYVYNGSQLMQMTKGSDTLDFIYDAAGRPTALAYNGTTYYYITNIQGDIVGIVDTTGETVATYTYDAWGNPIGAANTSTIANLNPLRYRGYVYDTETGLYYVSSRYYDPEIGRWINADSLIGIDDILGSNLFVYCDNNPVNKVDYSGEDGKHFELGNGWKYTIHPQDTTTGTKRHIHIWKDKEEYIQNEDGSPHDKGTGKKGKIPKWLNKKLIEKAGWDYNGKRKSFFEQTSCKHWVEGTHFTFADGSTAFRPYNPYLQVQYSVDYYEGVYFQGNIASSGTSNTTQTFYLPIIGHITLPAFSFGFGWGLWPIPLLC